MRRWNFEPGDGSFEVSVDSIDEVRSTEWSDAGVALLLNVTMPGGKSAWRVLKYLGESFSDLESCRSLIEQRAAGTKAP